MIPPGSGKDSIKIKADYVEGMSCTSINAGVHAQYNHFDNKQVMCGKRANDVCEVDSQCAHIICSNNQTALSEQYEESVCVPRDTDRERRVVYELPQAWHDSAARFCSGRLRCPESRG